MQQFLFTEILEVDGSSTPEALRWKKRRILRVLREIYDMDVAFISRLSQGMRSFDEVDQAHDFSVKGIEKGAAEPIESSYCLRVLRKEIPNLIPDARLEPGVQDLIATFSIPVGAHISVPIKLADGMVFGMLCAFSRRSDYSLSHRDLAMFELCADLLARDISAAPDAGAGMEAPLTSAISEGRFYSVLQPICDLGTLRPRGYELFTRFNPEMGPTERIFQSAKFLDLILPLEEQVLGNAARILDQVEAGCYLSVNLSASTLLDADILEIFARTDTSRIVLEITEHEAVENYEPLLRKIARAKAVGLRIAIDDVGAGFSSLRHLLMIRPDIVKLERSLISGIDSNAEKASLVKALLAHADELGAEIVAEGIETEPERAALMALGFRYGQGYLLGRPEAATAPETPRH